MSGADIAPTPSAQSAIDNLRFEAIEQYASLAASYARSAAEAAWRGERVTLHTHLTQLRLTVQEAIQTANTLGRPAGEA